MALERYLDESALLIGYRAPHKWALLERLVDAALGAAPMRDYPDLAREATLKAVLDREAQRSTLLEDGVALPHARLANFSGLGLSAATLAEPVDFGSKEAPAPVRLAILLLVPEAHPTVGLKVMGRLAQTLLHPEKRDLLLAPASRGALYNALRRHVLGDEGPVTALDIMRQPHIDIHPDTPLRQVTHAMLKHNLEAVSVVEQDGRIVGEITCDALFRLGVPDFFGQLKTVSFISEFNPFDNYFRDERRKRARDVMSPDFAALPEDATLLEIVYELAIKRRPRVYVVREGKRIGVIDRALVLDRVINF